MLSAEILQKEGMKKEDVVQRERLHLHSAARKHMAEDWHHWQGEHQARKRRLASSENYDRHLYSTCLVGNRTMVHTAGDNPYMPSLDPAFQAKVAHCHNDADCRYPAKRGHEEFKTLPW